MANRKRNIQVKFYVTAEEKELMEQKMAQLQTKRIGAYLRKMAIDGYIIQVDTRDIKEMNKLLSAIGRNRKRPNSQSRTRRLMVCNPRVHQSIRMCGRSLPAYLMNGLANSTNSAMTRQ